jgi:hypothetical protein
MIHFTRVSWPLLFAVASTAVTGCVYVTTEQIMSHFIQRNNNEMLIAVSSLSSFHRDNVYFDTHIILIIHT